MNHLKTRYMQYLMEKTLLKTDALITFVLQ